MNLSIQCGLKNRLDVTYKKNWGTRRQIQINFLKDFTLKFHTEEWIWERLRHMKNQMKKYMYVRIYTHVHVYVCYVYYIHTYIHIHIYIYGFIWCSRRKKQIEKGRGNIWRDNS